MLRQQVQAEPDALRSLEALAGLCEARGAFVEALAARRAALAVRSREGDPDLAEARTRVRALERLAQARKALWKSVKTRCGGSL